jgi:hypothetical protein
MMLWFARRRICCKMELSPCQMLASGLFSHFWLLRMPRNYVSTPVERAVQGSCIFILSSQPARNVIECALGTQQVIANHTWANNEREEEDP